MLNFGNKEFRNLQEQVLKNMQDINGLEFGLNIRGAVANVPDLPQDAKLGDAYLVGTERPYYIYVKTAEKEFRNLGTLESKVEGPQGIMGETGPKGERGSIITTGGEEPTIRGNEHDMYVQFNGDLYTFIDGKWQLTMSIAGPEGMQGPRGPKGDIGPQGPQGLIGPKGDRSVTIRVLGKVAHITDLPVPTTVPRDAGYIVTGENNTLFGLVGESNLTWMSFGSFVYPGFGKIAGTAFEGSAGAALEKEKVDAAMVDWGFGPEATNKNQFYGKVSQVFVNQPTQSIYMYGTPEELTPKFFNIWGTPEGFKATHAYIAIRPLSNQSSRISFKMYLSSSNYGNTHEITVAGYNGVYLSDSGWKKQKQNKKVDSLPKNLLDLSKITKNKFVLGDGSIIDFATASISDFIEVNRETVDLIKITLQDSNKLPYYNILKCYDESKNFICSVDTGGKTVDNKYRTWDKEDLSKNTKYIRVNMLNNTINDLMVLINEDYPDVYIPYINSKNNYVVDNIPPKSITKEMLADDITPTSPFKDKIMYNFGDSISFGAGFAGGYAGILKNEYGFNLTSYAANGNTVVPGCKLDSSTSVGSILRQVEGAKVDPADYILLEGGINDCFALELSVNADKSFGTISNGYDEALDENTFCGAFEKMLKTAITKYDSAKIVFILAHDGRGTQRPTWRTQYVPTIREMCKKWGISIVDVFNNTYPIWYITELKNKYTSGDGLHPNEAGYKHFYIPEIIKTL